MGSRTAVAFALLLALPAFAFLLPSTALGQTVRQEMPADAGSSASPGGTGSGPTIFEVRAAPEGVQVDGVLDEPAWEEAESIPLPYEVHPGDNIPSRVRTECRVTFDDENLYLGCTAYDPDPSSIRAFVTDRDRIFGNNDRISFLVDPFNDARRGWVFEVSALGVQADLVYDERTDDFDESWDAIWSSAGRITEEGYVVEAAIPFRSLRFPAGAEVQTWRFWINRMRPRSEFVTMRSNTRLRGEACQLCQANLLRGIRGVEPGLNVEIVPTLTASRTDSRAETFPGGPLADGPVEWEPGLDVRWSVTTGVALNATVNPDFSQVEADAPQLDANNRFALFFPEKRPFFLEAADLFQTPFRAVFTRTVADPIAGGKVTGKVGRNAFGVLVARDEVTNLLFPGDLGSGATSLDEDVTSAAVRYRRDLGASNTVGALYTGRLGEGGYSNHVAGVDAFFQPASSVTLNVQVLSSRTEYPTEVATAFGQPDRPFGGTAYVVQGGWSSSEWGMNAGLNTREGGFRADAGFIPQVDTRALWANGRRTWWGGEDAFLTRLTLVGGAWRDRTLSDRLIEEGVWTMLEFQGPAQSSGRLNPWRSREFFEGRTFQITGLSAGFDLRPVSSFRLGISGNVGDQIDFRNSREAFAVRLSPSFDLQVGRNAEVGARHSYLRLTHEGEEVLTQQVGQLRGVYNFNPRTFLRGIVQYRRTERNPETNADLERPLDEGLFTQLLFSYKINPLTVLFVGMTDDRSGFEDDLRTRVELTPRDRTFFFKVGWAWRP